MSTAYGDSFLASYLAAGVQAPQATANYETFSSITPGSAVSPFITNFNGSTYTGTYTGSVGWYAADQYGGAGGTSTYPETFSGYSVVINPSANYFGLWFSALDVGNQLQFYRDNTLLYTFTPQDFIQLVGACPGTAFCGNPNSQFLGQNSGQQYAYLNFYDSDGLFNKIVFGESGGGGFESDNHAVAVLSAAPGGTPINPTPEPAPVGALLLGLGLISLGKLRAVCRR